MRFSILSNKYRESMMHYLRYTLMLSVLCSVAPGDEFVTLDFGSTHLELRHNVSLSDDGSAAGAFNYDTEMQYTWHRERGIRNDSRLLPDGALLHIISTDGIYAFGNTWFGPDEPGMYRFSLLEEELDYIYDSRMRERGGLAWPIDTTGDGSVVVGYAKTESSLFHEPFLWTADTGVEWLGVLPDRLGIRPMAMSANAETVVGFAEDPCCIPDRPENYAVTWTRERGWRPIEGLGEEVSAAFFVSDDGSVVVGTASETNGAFRWTEAEGVVSLATSPMMKRKPPRALSSDGSVIVGGAFNVSGTDGGFAWTVESGLTEFDASLQDISSDGSVAVGVNYGSDAAVFWNDSHGVQDLAMTLRSNPGLSDDLLGWRLTEAAEISDDGTVILGFGISPAGEELAWAAFLDEPLGHSVAGDWNKDRTLSILDLDMLHAAVVADNHPAGFDLNGDTLVDSVDVHLWVGELFDTWIGDSNLDGEFNTTDLVDVFQAGKYEADVDATWSEGDWNADGRFGTRDLVAAFQDGGYERGPRAATMAVPEPASGWLLLTGLMLLTRRRQ